MITSATELKQWQKWITEGDPKEALRAMQDLIDGIGSAGPELVGAAKEKYALGSDDNIEIDDDAHESRADDGAWVQAWVWVPNPDSEED